MEINELDFLGEQVTIRDEEINILKHIISAAQYTIRDQAKEIGEYKKKTGEASCRWETPFDYYERTGYKLPGNDLVWVRIPHIPPVWKIMEYKDVFDKENHLISVATPNGRPPVDWEG